MMIERNLNSSLQLKIGKSTSNSEEFSSAEVKVDPDKQRQRKKQPQTFPSSEGSEDLTEQSLNPECEATLSEIKPRLGRRLDLLA